MQESRLFYRRPAGDWLEGLPIGTGRLAAMVPGFVPVERITLNHEWLWSRLWRDRVNDSNAASLQKIRDLLNRGEYEQGTIFANRELAPRGRYSGITPRIDAYQPAGELQIDLERGFSEYCRELDLNTGLVTVTSANIVYTSTRRMIRQYLAHLKLDLLVIRFTAEGQRFSGQLHLDRCYDPAGLPECRVSPDGLQMTGKVSGGTAYQVNAKLFQRGGTSLVHGDKLVIQDAEEAVLLVNLGTDANGGAPAAEAAIPIADMPDWNDLMNSHLAVYRKLYQDRLTLELPDDPELSSLPTNERQSRQRSGGNDPGLPLLYFNYARYLMLAGAARAELPLNLQGKWNQDLHPLWDCDYHLNINLQMNYWHADPCNTPEHNAALFRYLQRLAVDGRRSAREIWNCRGMWLPHLSDVWAKATPEGHGYSVWSGAAPWLAQHFWNHYEYTLDRNFLSEQAYPFLRDAAEFFEDFLTEDLNGQLRICPSQSPENRFAGGGAYPVTLCCNSSMDIQLIRELLTHAAAAAYELNLDPDKRQLWTEMATRLPPLKIGRDGRLLEWNMEVEEVEPGHRHVSHLYGVYPGSQINREDTPEYYAAARKSLEHRLNYYGGHTGWSRAWTACFMAAFGDGEAALIHLKDLIAKQSSASLLDLHPPGVFQIDGNLGAAAAIAAMLLRSENGIIELLPALPREWDHGHAAGFCTKGGFQLDFTWENSKITGLTIHAKVAVCCRLRFPGQVKSIRNHTGNSVDWKMNRQTLEFQTASESTYRIITI